MNTTSAFLGRFRHLRTIAAQGGVSVFHFALNLALLRLVSPHDYGVFAFAFVLAMFATALNHSLVSTPLLVYTPVVEDPRARTAQERMLGSVNLLLCIALVLGGAAWAVFSDEAAATGVGVSVFVAVYSARQYSRSIGYATLRPLVTAAGDVAYVLAGTALVAAIHSLVPDPGVGHVLGALAAANLVAMTVERVGLLRGERSDTAGTSREPPSPAPLAHFTLRGYAEIWEQSRWSLAGALTSLVVAQAHSFIVVAAHGPDAFAPLAAGFVLFGPVRVALQTWQNTVKPEIAIGLAERRFDDVRRQVRRTARRVVLAVVAMGVGLFVAWPLVHAVLYADNYADEPMAAIVAVWFLVTVVASSYNPASAALQSMKAFRALAIPTIWGALTSALLVVTLLAFHGPAATLWGVLAAETLVALWLPRLLVSRLDGATGGANAAVVPDARDAGERERAADDGVRRALP